MTGWDGWMASPTQWWTPGDGDGQGGLACCSSWGRKESDMTEWPNFPFPHCAHKSVLYICVSFAVLEIGSPVPCFWIPCVCVNMWYLFFSFWLTSLCIISWAHLLSHFKLTVVLRAQFFSFPEYGMSFYVQESFWISVQKAENRYKQSLKNIL